MIGSIRRECVDQIVVLGERHLKRVLSHYVDYCNQARTHLSLNKDAPAGREIHTKEQERVVSLRPAVGLRHEYRRIAA